MKHCKAPQSLQAFNLGKAARLRAESPMHTVAVTTGDPAGRLGCTENRQPSVFRPTSASFVR